MNLIKTSGKIFQSAFNHSATGMALVSHDGKWLHVNKALCDITGYTAEELLSMDYKKITHEEDLDVSTKSLEDVLTGKVNAAYIEKRYYHKKGHIVWVLLSFSVVRDDDGNVLCMISQTQDITNKKNFEIELKESEERYDISIRGASVGLWDWNIVTGSLYWSPRLKELMGINNENFVPNFTEWENRIHPDDHYSVMDRLRAHLEHGTIFDIIHRFKHNDGHYLWIHARAHAIWNEAGVPQRMAGSLDDITSKKKAEEQIEKYTQELERSNQDLDDFAHIASHDLKEPLRGLSNNALFLKEDYSNLLDNNANKRIDRIIYLSERMEKLISNLLHFSKIKSQRLALKMVDLNEVIKDISQIIDSVLVEANAKIIVPKKLPTIFCDELCITEIYRNLISNGIKYNVSDKKIIKISFDIYGSNKDKYIFYVKDNGIGIDKQHYEEIFGIFRRLNYEDDNIKGTGMGLTFVKKLVERHGGKIWLESEPGQGSCFYFAINSTSNII